MYDLCPEWGPTRHRDPNEPQAHRRQRYWESAPAGTALMERDPAPERRDADEPWPDDN